MEFERDSGWLALAVAGSGTPAQDWQAEIGDLVLGLGWRTDRERYLPPPAHSPTLAVLSARRRSTQRLERNRH